MENKYKIGFVGSVSCGKTTLVNALSKKPEFEGYEFIVERSKYLRDLGIPLDTQSTLKGQIMFLAERTSELLKPGGIITDRTIVDVMAFTRSSDVIPERDKDNFDELAVSLLGEYDFIFYVPIEGVKLENNSVRATDSKYRVLIDEMILNILDDYSGSHIKNLIGIPPYLTTEKRVEFVMNCIKLCEKIKKNKEENIQLESLMPSPNFDKYN